MSTPSLPAPHAVPATAAPTAATRAAPAVLGWRGAAWATLAILASAFISQGLSFSNLAFALFWPPAGIAFALCWRYGARALPAIALGIAVPTFSLYPGWGSTLVVLGETLGPWAGALLLRRHGPPAAAAPLRWQIAFYGCGVALACPIAALCGSLGAVAGGRFPLADLPGVCLAYLVVESIGLVLFAPPASAWLARRDPAAEHADPAGTPRARWLFALPVVIEAARWLLHATAGAAYADLLVYGYFPLVAWCALTERVQRTNALLLCIAIATLSSEALRLHGEGAPVANFALFRIALVTLVVSTMGQVLAALASERRAAFADVARQRDLDPLTGLHNETRFARDLDRVARPLKVVLLAFDNWPEFEILAGIGASYDLQREVAQLLAANPGLDGVARLQPGTFAAWLRPGVVWPEPLLPLIRRRWSSGQVEMRLATIALDVPAHDASAASELLLGARTVLGEAVFSGDERPVLRPWSPALIAGRRAYEHLVDVIKHRVRAGEVRLFAQPIVPVRAGLRPTLEVLVRIDGEAGETLPPADVARVLARNIVSTELDRVVIRATFEWFAARPHELSAVERIAINLTGASLSAPTLFDWIERCRAAARLPARPFAFEITESQAILNMDCALDLVRRLRGAGYGVVLDDFGTGLATFDYLKRFPVDYLKIDGSFVRNLATNAVDREIVTGIVRLARVMQLGTVAEYVADEATAAAAVSAGVDALQGYAIRPPLPLAEALAWCRSADAACVRAWCDPLLREALA
jgi:EAL domain-containing protein (putative c-di-GMP-specific phosphodiesterase class I)/integral membrane sensor domain MASE1